MPAYILETARSYPNPIDAQGFKKIYERPASGSYRSYGQVGSGTNYQISLNSAGPGSMPLGTDSVHYIGDQRETCIDNCGFTRRPIYRYFRGSKRDHKYTGEAEVTRADLGCENEDFKKAAQGYNKEPRSATPIFFALDREVAGSVELKSWYSYDPDNTKLTIDSASPAAYEINAEGCGKYKYEFIQTLGWVFPSQAAAMAYAGSNETAVPLYHYLMRKAPVTKGMHIDDFYTTDPANEINLVGGPIAPRDPLDQEYVYQGILCWLFREDAPDAPLKKVIEIGKVGPTGQCIDKSLWYQFQPGFGQYSYWSYRRGGNIPGLIGFGNPANAAIISADANFEWLYGINGAIKGAVPRYLAFEDSYDSQFLYYLYDTSYPWNGPVFGIQYQLTNAACCPDGTGDDGPTCNEVLGYYSHFYEIREDSWQTTQTNIKIVSDGVRIDESFSTFDTNTPRILFRYLTRNGDFNKGEKINGWDIVSVLYFGNKLKCGSMELSKAGGSLTPFTYKQQFTSSDGGTIEVLAGYGISNKAAFAGVYEFPKKVSYYKVEIDPSKKIPTRSLDQFEGNCILDDKGTIIDVDIINGGRGYTKEAKVICITPRIMDNWSATDGAKFRENSISGSIDPNKAIAQPEVESAMFDSVRDSQTTIAALTGDIKQMTDKDKDRFLLKAPTLIISEVSAEGVIMDIRVVDGGAGYSAEHLPKIFISDPDYFTRKADSPGNLDIITTGVNDMFTNITGAGVGAMKGIVSQGMGIAMGRDPSGEFPEAPAMSSGLQQAGSSSTPDSYIRITEISEDKTKFCQNLPANCIQITGDNGDIINSIPQEDNLLNIIKFSPGFAQFYKEGMSQIYAGVEQQTSMIKSQGNGLYGFQGGSSCLTVSQPKLYNVTRWFDVPCAYLAKGEDGKQKAFGWMPYKYCASTQTESSFIVSMNFEGKVIGSQGPTFMNYLQSFAKPILTETRDASGGYQTWACEQGAVKGRCYRNPVNPSDIVFAPVGGDENTYDYNRLNYTEYEQFRLWLGGNLLGGSLGSGSRTWTVPIDQDSPTGQDSVSFTTFQISCTPNPATTNTPNFDCWDKYVRRTGNTSGPLTVYCGYNNLGVGIPGLRFWEITGPGPNGTVHPFCTACVNSFGGGGYASPPNVGLNQVADVSIAVDPQRIYSDSKWANNTKVMIMGPYNGTMRVRNWLTGSVTNLSRMLRNFGNPYFDECDVAQPYIDGNRIEDL